MGAPFEGPGPDATYRQNLAEGKFRIQYSPAADKYVFYPRILCPHTGSPDLEWRDVSGKGTVYSTSVIRRRPESGGNYNIAIVALEEGARMMSRVEGLDPTEVKIGMAVKARIVTEDNLPIVVFDPA